MTYELIRSNRKTIALQIKGDGRVILSHEGLNGCHA